MLTWGFVLRSGEHAAVFQRLRELQGAAGQCDPAHPQRSAVRAALPEGLQLRRLDPRCR